MQLDSKYDFPCFFLTVKTSVGICQVVATIWINKNSNGIPAQLKAIVSAKLKALAHTTRNWVLSNTLYIAVPGQQY